MFQGANSDRQLASARNRDFDSLFNSFGTCRLTPASVLLQAQHSAQYCKFGPLTFDSCWGPVINSEARLDLCSQWHEWHVIEPHCQLNMFA